MCTASNDDFEPAVFYLRVSRIDDDISDTSFSFR